MPTTHPTANRSMQSALVQILDALKDDHKRVKKAYRAFQKLGVDGDPALCQTLVQQVLDELTVHAAIEEELLYPAARAALADAALIDEAEVEHGSLHALIDVLRGQDPGDDKYCARFTVLCEYVLHHVKEEEGEMFPQLESTKVDWASVAARIEARRAELTGANADGDAEADTESQADEDSDSERPQRGASPALRPAPRRGAASGPARDSDKLTRGAP